MAMTDFAGIYQGKKVLLTGHTGFKGSWLAMWLLSLGARVVGVALPPDTSPSHWDLLALDIPEHRVDIRDSAKLGVILRRENPDIVFHLAAQPLVRRSYREPLDTWSTNVMGTANLLEACRHCDALRAAVIVTTDKVYKNREQDRGYHEDETLGGHDPYSASKAACELVAASYRSAFFHSPGAPLIATARAGNVIGGGDWCEDRLIPDLIRAMTGGSTLTIRSPQSTRPWQHVLECLSGYLLVGQMLLEGHDRHACAWNFGPELESAVTVGEVLVRLKKRWPELAWQTTDSAQPHEAALLSLDSGKAKKELGWRPVWALEDALDATAEWYRAYLNGGHVESHSQLAAYVTAARRGGAVWGGA